MCNVSAHDRIILPNHFSWKNGRREGPLRGLRTRAIPRIRSAIDASR